MTTSTAYMYHVCLSGFCSFQLSHSKSRRVCVWSKWVYAAVSLTHFLFSLLLSLVFVAVIYHSLGVSTWKHLLAMCVCVCVAFEDTLLCWQKHSPFSHTRTHSHSRDMPTLSHPLFSSCMCECVLAICPDIFATLKDQREGRVGASHPLCWLLELPGCVDRLISPRWLPCLFSRREKEGGGGRGGRLTDNLSVYTLPLYYWWVGWVTDECVCVWVCEGVNQGSQSKFHHSGLTLTTSISFTHTHTHLHSHTLPSERPRAKKVDWAVNELTDNRRLRLKSTTALIF